MYGAQIIKSDLAPPDSAHLGGPACHCFERVGCAALADVLDSGGSPGPLGSSWIGLGICLCSVLSWWDTIKHATSVKNGCLVDALIPLQKRLTLRACFREVGAVMYGSFVRHLPRTAAEPGVQIWHRMRLVGRRQRPGLLHSPTAQNKACLSGLSAYFSAERAVSTEQVGH